MARYTTSVAGQNLSTANDLRTFVTTATGAGSVIALYEIKLDGEESASSVARIAINRPSANGITQNTAQTPEKIDPASAAAAYTVTALAGWTTQPVLSTNDVLIIGFNAFGGIDRWVAYPGSEVITGSQGAVANLAIRSRSGTGVVSGHILCEQR
jgi:hypothetical protein